MVSTELVNGVQSYLPGTPSPDSGVVLIFFTLPIHIVYMKQRKSSVLSPTYAASALESCPLLRCLLSSVPRHPACASRLVSVSLLFSIPSSPALSTWPFHYAPVPRLCCSPQPTPSPPSHMSLDNVLPTNKFQEWEAVGPGGAPSVFACLLIGVHSQLSPTFLHLTGLWDPCFWLSLLLATLGFILSTSVTNL